MNWNTLFFTTAFFVGIIVVGTKTGFSTDETLHVSNVTYEQTIINNNYTMRECDDYSSQLKAITTTCTTMLEQQSNIKPYPRTYRKCTRPIPFGDYYGDSMQPFLYAGDIFYVEKVRFEDIVLGDVILFVKNDERILHAVTGVYDGFVHTAGYNRPYYDGVVTPDMIKYRWCDR